ncbi:GTPase HflX [Ancylobacter sp. VNQ12]|uniref:GTPase HflX n=1 Tax=Ancylobacter sp. VNQ12 TaxID=3400920 RepID=UPI003BFE6C42
MEPKGARRAAGSAAGLPPGSPEGGDATKVVVIVPHLTRRAEGEAELRRSPEARLDEAVGLALAIDLGVVASMIVGLAQVRPASYLGSGKVEEIAGIVKAEDAGLVFVDAPLSPVQQRNLEKAWSAKVIDRTALILEIFGQRARTKEGVLQVELAHLNYQRSRLVRSWTHLERQRGGFGFLGGPGETQIEADRRLIGERIVKIERELEQVKRTRALHRASRKKVPYPVVALVGYTNAGKSTLFNKLTSAKVMAQDLLFATLDPTLRAVQLPTGEKVIVSDTVGFISDLPTQLVAAFRATLEEVIEADIILHVRDMSHEDAEAQAHDVARVLSDLDIDPDDHARLIEVWNKIDRLDEDARAAIFNTVSRREGDDRPIPVSALTGEGIPTLLAVISQRLARERVSLKVDLDATDGEGLSWLYRHTEVIDRREDIEGHIHLAIRVPPERAEHIEKRFRGRRIKARGAA